MTKQKITLIFFKNLYLCTYFLILDCIEIFVPVEPLEQVPIVPLFFYFFLFCFKAFLK